MAIYTIDFEPLGRRGKCRDNETLLVCDRKLGGGISSVCGGIGACSCCKIRILGGTVSKPTANETDIFSPQELQNGWRLACQTYPESNCKVNVPAESMTTPQRIQLEGLEAVVQPEPPVRGYHLQLSTPTFSDPQADADRLLGTLNEQHRLHCNRIDLEVLRTFSSQLRSLNWRCEAMVCDDEVIALGHWPSRKIGLAIDLGTTKLAGYLIDMSTGQTLAARGLMNPQISYGEDIMSRMAATIKSPDVAIQLQKAVVQALNELTNDLCNEVAVTAQEIVESVVVANTAMHHLFLALPVTQLGLAPYIPAARKALDLKARDLGFRIAPGAYVHILPNIAGFVGADHVAMLLATEVWQDKGPTLAIDIGTNTEISLIRNRRITSLSCASGPAFEGGHIKDGMRAASGAIERVRITKRDVQLESIDGAPPIGICGSGLLDAVAQLYTNGVIGKEGRIRNNHPRVQTHQGQREFVLVSEKEDDKLPAIVITQQDVSELQLAKAAIRTGIQVLLETNDCTEEDIKQVIIAGAFGSYIDVASAITIGMLPSLPLERFRQVGNAAGMGAKQALISVRMRTVAQDIASQVRYIELANSPNFKENFIQANYFGQYRIIKGERKYID